MPSLLRIALALAVAILISGVASATPLGLTPTTPDITSGYIQVNYNATTDAFVATGFSLTYDDGSGPVDLENFGEWTLSATIDSSGSLSGGTLTVWDDVELLSGTLTAVGFSGTANTALEFLFDVTGGSLASAYASTGGVILGGGAALNFPGSWTSSFSNSGNATADTFYVAPVPEPSTALLLALGMSALGWGGRRQG